MYTRKSKGPKSEPCGTPLVTGLVRDSEPPKFTTCVLLVK